uniref:Ribosome biogenesis protein NOP53 n=1 Tax=Panagrolaimus sp. JU765 TaxID=591449 RepID=A0AC34Q8D8_9BILA
MGKSKKAWKKLRSADELIPTIQIDKQLESAKNDELFTLDDEGEKSVVKLTPRQKRLEAHKERLAKLDADIKDVKKVIKPIAKRQKIVLAKGKIRGKEPTPPPEPEKPKAIAYKDIWEEKEEDPVEKVDDFLKDGLSYDLKVRKITRVRKPKISGKYMPTAKAAVQVAKEGASYNPDINNYVNYANEIADEEATRLLKQKRLEESLALPEGMRYITPEEERAEKEQGFFEESSDEEDEKKIDVDDEPIPPKPRNKPKTMKKKRRYLAHKIALFAIRDAKKLRREQNAQFDNIKKLVREMNAVDSETEKNAKARAAQKLFRQLLGKKKLGAGKFEKYEEPVLLPSEIRGSLRLAKTEGSLLTERFKSMQERNLLPTSGDKNKKKLPKRLKRKYVEKRDAKRITATSRVI